MALINCPECGRQVSDSATQCPTCGYPIAKNKPSGDVRIKMNIQGYMMSMSIYDADTNEQLWKGMTGSVAVIHVEKPTNIVIKGRSGKTTATIKAGEKYEFTSVPGFFIPKDVLNRIDTIDSD